MVKRSSQELIARMQDRGRSLEQIARLVGRDSSLIGQINRGLKPGTNLQAALARASRVKNVDAYLARKGPIATPRRVTAKGTPARVRQGWKDLPGGKQSVGGTKIGPTFRKRIERAARKHENISISALYEEVEYGQSTVNDTGAEATLAEHGWSAEAVLNALDRAGWPDDPQQAFEDVMATNPRLGARTGFKRYAITAMPRKR